MDSRPIGVFDSGLGGITTVKELGDLMPNEDIVYFGDTGRVPYGTKSRETILKYASQDIRFLLEHDVKAIVIACGTVSSNAFEEARGMSPVPVIGVIRPAVKAAVEATRSSCIGVLGTSSTIRSGSFEREIRKALPDAKIKSKACPMFVPLVENGYIGRDNQVTGLIAREYLAGLKSQVDTVILGCTHYPLIQDVIRDVLGNGVTLVNTGREAAKAASALLRREGLLKGGEGEGSCSFFASDTDGDFARLVEMFLNRPVGKVGKVDIERY